jgi:hypothetical protein
MLFEVASLYSVLTGDLAMELSFVVGLSVRHTDCLQQQR